ncbi:MAG: hypothetical protein E7207_00205 [Clostridium butyricum]|nr:hypothetical protein [Clostridium butyricum]
MIEIKKIDDDLLKNSIDYEDYSENICKLTVEEMQLEGLLKCGGCCGAGGGSKCNNWSAKSKCGCYKCKNK